ncbi:MAG: molybdopterin cofactor-binding domain-containing protein [Candidatus Promineifilaceae bacterium]|nr:molybdopterin cofactor-binding domain-containing protein [Candidatus Promineifilaceae bacterium]
MSQKYHIVGKSPVRVDGIEKVTGAAKYAADYDMAGMLYGRIKRSPHAHARVTHIDTTAAEAMPGVKAVITFKDVPQEKHAGLPVPREGSLAVDQQILTGVARFVGDGIAAVAAITEEIAEEALELIEVEYELLPVIIDPDSALSAEAPRIHDKDSNQVTTPINMDRGDVQQGFAAADYIVEGVYKTGRPVHCYMEPNACVCRFDSSGKLTVWSSTQGAFSVRRSMSEVLDIPLHKIQVIVEHMGGGFGAKQDLYQHEYVCAILARKTGRPVKMEYSRKETFLASRTRHPVTVHLKQGVTRDGVVTAREATYVSNTGGYASHGPGITAVGTIDLTSLYRCEENWKLEGRSIYTNAPIAGAYRGYGAVQGFFALDVNMDEMAETVGMDPVTFRIKNAVGEGDLSPSGHRLHGDSLSACLQRGADEVNWAGKWQPPSAKSGRVRSGLGVGTEMHSSGAYPDIKEVSSAIIRLNEDGSLNLLTGAADLGTGALTVMAQIAAEVLGVDLEDIEVKAGDTDVVPYDTGAYASRTTHIAGKAVEKAAVDMKRQLLELAAQKLEAAPGDLDIERGQVLVKGAPAISLRELVSGDGGNPAQALISQATHHSKVAYSFAAHFAEVEVDTETGQIEVKQVTAVHEIGQAINRRGVEGQIEGGIQQGLGHSISEDFILDPETGRPLNPSFVDYKMPLAMDMPPIKTIILETEPDLGGPFGAKGVGEDPIIAIGPAIANAVYNAIGVRIRELPITPEKVLQALQK